MPTMLVEKPFGIACVFSDGRRVEYCLDDLPNPRLARDLATGLVDLIHPHGTVNSDGTVTFYVRALRSTVRTLVGPASLVVPAICGRGAVGPGSGCVARRGWKP